MRLPAILLAFLLAIALGTRADDRGRGNDGPRAHGHHGHNDTDCDDGGDDADDGEDDDGCGGGGGGGGGGNGTLPAENDYGSGGDASNACDAPAPTIAEGTQGNGTLAPPLDPSDNYAFPVATPGAHVFVLTQTSGNGTLRLTVWSPGCGVEVGTPFDAPGDVHVVAFNATQAGVYTIRVDAGAGAGAPRVRALAAPVGIDVGPSCDPSCSYSLGNVV
jgi:hypothetical protein